MEKNINGYKINYEYHKNINTCHTIVFIHGWMDSMQDSNENIIELSEFFNVLRFDLPGHGQSEKTDSYSLDLYAEYAFSFIKSFDIDFRDITLIGHSMGAVIGLVLYEKYSDNFSKIILLDPPLGKFPLLVRLLIPLLFFLKILGLLKLILNIIRRARWFQKFWCDSFIGEESRKTNEARRITISGILDADIEVIIQGALDTINNKLIAVPPLKDPKIYLIYGDKDPIINLEHRDDLFIENHIFSINNEKHTPNRTNPQEFNNIIINLR